MAACLRQPLQPPVDVVEGIVTIDLGLAVAQEIQVGAVQDKYGRHNGWLSGVARCCRILAQIPGGVHCRGTFSVICRILPAKSRKLASFRSVSRCMPRVSPGRIERLLNLSNCPYLLRK